jgi:hypothetical protein
MQVEIQNDGPVTIMLDSNETSGKSKNEGGTPGGDDVPL